MRVFDFDYTDEPPQATDLNRQSVDTEHTLESWLHANPEVILDEPLLLFGRQYGLSTGVPDLLALDQWANVVVVELKRGKSGSGSASEETILSQPQNYASDLSRYEYDDLEDIYSEYKQRVQSDEWAVGETPVVEDSLQDAYEATFGGSVEPSAYNRHQRMVILAEEITRRTETNARYLNEQGLNVQCVQVQLFTASGDGPQSDYSVLASQTVVDYPQSEIRPQRSREYTDYSGLTLDVRDEVVPEVADDLHLDDPDDVSATGSRLRITSNHPDHPDNVRYEFDPRIEESGHVRCGIGIYDADDELHRRIYSVLSDHFDGLDVESATLTDNATKSQGVVEKRVDVAGTLEDVTDEQVNEFVSTLVRLIDHYHPRIVEAFRDETAH